MCCEFESKPIEIGRLRDAIAQDARRREARNVSAIDVTPFHTASAERAIPRTDLADTRRNGQLALPAGTINPDKILDWMVRHG